MIRVYKSVGLGHKTTKVDSISLGIIDFEEKLIGKTKIWRLQSWLVSEALWSIPDREMEIMLISSIVSLPLCTELSRSLKFNALIFLTWRKLKFPLNLLRYIVINKLYRTIKRTDLFFYIRHFDCALISSSIYPTGVFRILLNGHSTGLTSVWNDLGRQNKLASHCKLGRNGTCWYIWSALLCIYGSIIGTLSAFL